MKKVIFLSVLSLLHFVSTAQKVYFIYLQSESTAPFYIKMSGKIQSSSSEGYLIIPKLTDSTYLITVGQPGKQNEPRFAITVNKGDKGFLIKNLGNEFGLFDLQTLALHSPLTSEISTTPAVTRNDNFTKILAKAADDSTLLSQPVMVQEKKVRTQEVIKEVVPLPNNPQQNTSASSVSDTIVKTALEKDTLQKEQSYVMLPAEDTIVDTTSRKKDEAKEITDEFKRSIVTRKSESSTSEGLGLVFLDDFVEGVDTIRLIIPNPKLIEPDSIQKQPVEKKQFLEINNEKVVSQIDSTITKTRETTVTKNTTSCKVLSNDDDFFKFRRDMAAKNNEDDMLIQARKYFKNKCYRTEQIKYLSTLFLTDEGKYRFFDAAFMHVSDRDKFSSLQSEIIDSYYINRFKALIGN